MKNALAFILFLVLLGTIIVNAQSPTAILQKATTAPIINGVADDEAWAAADVEPININLPFNGEHPTLGTEGDTYWKAIYTDDGIYVLVNVTDDLFFPSYKSTGDNSKKDHVEIYFDCNPELIDGGGANDGPANGHHQFAPDLLEAEMDGTTITGTTGQLTGVTYATLLTGTNYVQEYFFPFSVLNDTNGAPLNPAATIGFDVYVVDNDTEVAVFNRAVWANDGSNGAENCGNMDNSGFITLEGTVCKCSTIPAEDIIITSPSDIIDTHGGTMQFSATILPENTTIKKVKWEVENGVNNPFGRATISEDGLLTAVSNGEVVVKATTIDGSELSDYKQIFISNQIVTVESINVFACIPGTETLSASIDTKGGQLQVSATVLPYDAANKSITYSIVNQTGKASITTGGLLTAEADGTVLVIGTALDGSNVTGSLLITISNNPISVPNPIAVSEKAIIYPIPVTNKLNVKTTSPNAILVIYNCLGNVILEKSVMGTETTIDVSNFAHGVYYITVNNSSAQKFVK